MANPLNASGGGFVGSHAWGNTNNNSPTSQSFHLQQSNPFGRVASTRLCFAQNDLSRRKATTGSAVANPFNSTGKPLLFGPASGNQPTPTIAKPMFNSGPANYDLQPQEHHVNPFANTVPAHGDVRPSQTLFGATGFIGSQYPRTVFGSKTTSSMTSGQPSYPFGTDPLAGNDLRTTPTTTFGKSAAPQSTSRPSSSIGGLFGGSASNGFGGFNSKPATGTTGSGLLGGASKSGGFGTPASTSRFGTPSTSTFGAAPSSGATGGFGSTGFGTNGFNSSSQPQQSSFGFGSTGAATNGFGRPAFEKPATSSGFKFGNAATPATTGKTNNFSFCGTSQPSQSTSLFGGTSPAPSATVFPFGCAPVEPVGTGFGCDPSMRTTASTNTFRSGGFSTPKPSGFSSEATKQQPQPVLSVLSDANCKKVTLTFEHTTNFPRTSAKFEQVSACSGFGLRGNSNPWSGVKFPSRNETDSPACAKSPSDNRAMTSEVKVSSLESTPTTLVAAPDVNPYGSGSFGDGLIEKVVKEALNTSSSTLANELSEEINSKRISSPFHYNAKISSHRQVGLSNGPLSIAVSKSCGSRHSPIAAKNVTFKGSMHRVALKLASPPKNGAVTSGGDQFQFRSSLFKSNKKTLVIETGRKGSNVTNEVKSQQIQTTKLNAEDNREQTNGAALNQSKSISSAAPLLKNSSYYTIPAYEHLQQMGELELMAVKDFMIGCEGIGTIQWPGKSDLRYLDLDAVIQFRAKEVVVYPDEYEGKPAVGEALNKRAIIQIHGIKRADDDPRKAGDFEDRLKSHTKALGAELLAYSPINGVWKFQVEHF